MDEDRSIYLASLVMSNETPVALAVPVNMLWLIINSLQLTAIHPNLSPIIREMNEDIGRQLGELVLEQVPDVAELLEMGWHREYDVPIDDGDLPGGLPFASG